MNMERALLDSRRVAAETRAQDLAMRIGRLKQELKLYLANHQRPSELDATKVQQVSGDLLTVRGKYEAALAEIAALRDELGMARYEER